MCKEDWVRKIQNGDHGALEALWEDVKPFAQYIVKRYTPRPSVDFDDLMQCAFLGVCTAALAYDGRYELMSLVSWCIRRECRRALSLDRPREPETVSYDAPMNDDAEDGAFIDAIPDNGIIDTCLSLELADLCKAVQEAVRALPERQSAIIRQHYFSGLTLEDIAQKEGISKERVRQLERKGFDALSRSGYIAPYVREYAPIKGVGLRSFQRHGTSAVEHVAIKNVEQERKDQTRLLRKQANKELALHRRMVADGYYTQDIADMLFAQWALENGYPIKSKEKRPQPSVTGWRHPSAHNQKS